MNTIPRTLVAGIGSPHGDDQAGWQVIRELRDSHLATDVEFRITRSPADLLDWLEDRHNVIIIDACQGLGQPGEWRRLDWPASELATCLTAGTHDFSLPAALTLATQLNRLPSQVEIWMIEARTDQVGEAMSGDVLTGLPGLVAALRQRLAVLDPSDPGDTSNLVPGNTTGNA